MISAYWVLSAILLSSMWLSVKLHKLTIAGAITGGCTGLCIFLGAGFTGIIMTGMFFILGSFASSWKVKDKERLGVAEENKGRRTSGQVLANAGIAGITGLMAWQYPANAHLFQLMMAAGIAAATGDTLSSEFGNVYGRRFYHVLTFRKDQRGLDGVISLEGTLFGLAGSMVIALMYGLGLHWNKDVLYIIIAGLTGNLADSVMGATLERKKLLGNNAVNFLNTCIGALTALLLSRLF